MIIALGIADLIMLGSFLLTYNHLPPQIPFFYSRPWGEAQLADLWVIGLLPLFMHILIFLNYFLVKKVFPADEIISRITKVVNWSLLVAFTGIFLKIIFLIT